jgi:hypothetical protein
MWAKIFNFAEDCAKQDGIEWHSGLQPLMTFNGSAPQRCA